MQSTNSFDAQIGRLKGALQLKEDQEVAELMGMGKAAFSARRTRGSFPEEKLRALAQQRPDLNIDVDYVITGVAQAALEMIRAAREGKPLKKVSAEELLLLENYRACTPPDQEAIRHQAQFLAERRMPIGADGRYPQRVDAPPATLHDKPRKKGV
jgi:hypothetical protein